MSVTILGIEDRVVKQMDNLYPRKDCILERRSRQHVNRNCSMSDGECCGQEQRRGGKLLSEGVISLRSKVGEGLPGKGYLNKVLK